MPNNPFSENLRKAALQAVNAMQPADFFYGTVTSTGPLTIQIEQKQNLTLSTAQLALSSLVQDVSTKIVIDGETKTVKRLGGLKKGERVALIRQTGGQQFFIVDRVN